LGHDYTINQYYEVVADVLGYEGGFTHDLSKPVGMARRLVSTKRQEAWGWRGKTSLNEGVQLTYRFYSQDQK